MKPLRLIRRIRASRYYEQWHPYLLGVLAACVCCWLGLGLPANERVRLQVLGSSVSAASIMFGFLATSLILLLSFEGARKKAFDRSGFTADVVRYVQEAIYLALAFTVVNLVGYFLNSAQVYYMGIWIGLAAAMLAGFHRVFITLIWLMRGS